MNEWNSSRCVTEYYITLSLHMHGAGTHTHTRGGGDSRHTRVHTPCSAAAGWGAGCSLWSPKSKSGSATHTEPGVPHSHLCVPPREEAHGNIRDV